ncbi:hypothetical protein HIM_03531 [Hirsutella minnesotensis 3608]|uniref:Uncharacterized protein n=1 Tax=Hirsutella minnesotensis 3608 TaxID=1043627 RepID=A0A0F7ZQG5_9HYPO|nr:hypothetical protein HIM_03531 [Hirsutella minnesotensis 3608]
MVKLSRTLALSALSRRRALADGFHDSTCAASQDASCIATVTRTVTAAGSSCPWAAVDCGACFSLDPQPSTRGTGSVPIPSSGVPSWKYRSYPQTNCSVPVCPTAKPPRYASSSLDAATGESPSAPRTVTKTIRRTLSTGFRSPSASATSAVGDGDVVQITAIVVNHTTTTTTRYSRLPSGSAVAPTGNATSTTAAAGDLTSYSHGHGTGLPGGYELSTRPAASEAWSSSSLVSFSESFDADIGTAPPSFTAVPVRTLVTSRKSSDTFVEGSWPATQTTPAWTRVDETWTEAPPSYTAPASYGSRFRLIRR